jgi:deoxyribonuclease V
MKVKRLHSWQLSVAQAQDLQRRMAGQVLKQGEVTNPHFIAGADISTEKGQEMATAAVVVLNYPELKLVETRIIKDKLGFPYIPGLLSFRESPLILTACEQLAITPDLILVDGQGLAHPRRFGIASHLGLLLDTPTIGCAKSRLCGTHRTPEVETGSYADIIDKGELIGVALRTRPGTNPVYVSIGHKVDLATAIRWVLNCYRGYRIPEPLRLAHLAAGGNLKPENKASVADNGHQGKLF